MLHNILLFQKCLAAEQAGKEKNLSHEQMLKVMHSVAHALYMI